MIDACTLPTHADYPAHGALGVTVCPEWQADFFAFTDWALTHEYAEDRFLIRIQLEQGFAPTNCWWVSVEVFRRYVHYCRPIPGEGRVQPLGLWVADARCRVSLSNFTHLLSKGWDLSEQILRPLRLKISAGGSIPLPTPVFPSAWFSPA